MRILAGLLWAGGLVALAYAARWVLKEVMIWRPRAVYKINDKAGSRLYIGSAYNVEARMRRHRSDQLTKSLWYPEASLKFQHTLEPDEVRWYRNAPLAFQAESEAIRREQPPGNIVGNPNARRRLITDD